MRETRFNTKEEVFEAIEKKIAEAKKCAKDAHRLAGKAEDLFNAGMVVEGNHSEAESKRLERKAARITVKHLAALKDKLAELQTGVLFKDMDPSVPRKMR